MQDCNLQVSYSFTKLCACHAGTLSNLSCLSQCEVKHLFILKHREDQEIPTSISDQKEG